MSSKEDKLLKNSPPTYLAFCESDIWFLSVTEVIADADMCASKGSACTEYSLE